MRLGGELRQSVAAAMHHSAGVMHPSVVVVVVTGRTRPQVAVGPLITEVIQGRIQAPLLEATRRIQEAEVTIQTSTQWMVYILRMAATQTVRCVVQCRR
jgi:hypothetical protein